LDEFTVKILVKPSSRLRFRSVHNLAIDTVTFDDSYIYHFKYKSDNEIKQKVNKWRNTDKSFCQGYNLDSIFKRELDILSKGRLIEHHLADNCEKIEMLIPK
jgi:hypothetical protein